MMFQTSVIFLAVLNQRGKNKMVPSMIIAVGIMLLKTYLIVMVGALLVDISVAYFPVTVAKILTPRREVDKYLQKFGNLHVVKIEENPHAKEGGALFNKFKDRYQNLPKNQRTTQLAFHGTPEANIPSICAKGYDSSRRRGQAYGPGEYFALSPDVSMGYCGSGRKMLLNELLLGQNGVHHTQHGGIIVMKDPVHDLPRFIITFQ